MTRYLVPEGPQTVEQVRREALGSLARAVLQGALPPEALPAKLAPGVLRARMAVPEPAERLGTADPMDRAEEAVSRAQPGQPEAQELAAP